MCLDSPAGALWLHRDNSKWDAGLPESALTGTLGSSLSARYPPRRRTREPRRTGPNMMADEDNAVQALLIKGVALVVIYFILAQILPTPPPRV